MIIIITIIIIIIITIIIIIINDILVLIVLLFIICQFEMKNRFVNHARNLWERAVSLLPRVDQFWYKYAYMEEMLGNVGGVRQIFERYPSATFIFF
jgi:hypothetical protein